MKEINIKFILNSLLNDEYYNLLTNHINKIN